MGQLQKRQMRAGCTGSEKGTGHTDGDMTAFQGTEKWRWGDAGRRGRGAAIWSLTAG